MKLTYTRELENGFEVTHNPVVAHHWFELGYSVDVLDNNGVVLATWNN